MKATSVFLMLMVCSYPVNKGRAITTAANARLIETCVKAFKDASGRLPTREEGLNVLIQKPSDWPAAIEWTSFLETAELPRDGWSHDFIYVLDPNLPHGFGIYSCGQDGVTSSNGNDRDDINTWNVKTSWRTYYRLSAMVTDRRLALVAVALILAAAGVVLVKRLTAKPRSNS
jgi:general secretion pathway protein G